MTQRLGDFERARELFGEALALFASVKNSELQLYALYNMANLDRELKEFSSGAELYEATASLDSESERLVQDAIARLCKGRTTIVVAHRLATIMHADRILVVEDGVIAESGRHDDLLRRNGRYASFYRLQLRDQAPQGPIAIASSG